MGDGVPDRAPGCFGYSASDCFIKKQKWRVFAILEVTLLAFVIPYLLFIGIHKIKFARHLLILYPALMMLVAIGLARLPSAVGGLLKITDSGSPSLVAGTSKRYAIFEKWGVSIIVGVVVLYSFIYTTAFASVMLVRPTRIAASEWISAHIPPEEAIAGAPVVLFNWLLPDVDLEVGDQEAEWVLILVPHS